MVVQDHNPYLPFVEMGQYVPFWVMNVPTNTDPL